MLSSTTLKGYQRNNSHSWQVEPEVEQNLPVDIPDSFDPSLRFDELQVESQSKSGGPKDELASFKQFGISRYYNCKCEFLYMYDSYLDET